MKKKDVKKIKKEERKVITISDRKKVSLEEEFKKYKGNNLSKEFKWDNPVGRETI